MLHPTGMDWDVIAMWGSLAGLMACGVAAWEWLEARAEARRRTERMLRRPR
ncbi:MAG: hypothetical protein HYS77_12010 [Candidatus Rokubacteria bacterium]|nr:hypothetical protein [Candidatus Rokubacteria bacterium]MBI2016245.1 hypothetical protein [Candidatus Rokubacteria bacterium]MBI2157921.1 hypothetical protein [Candidatus Rokubacteria bacterium]MBI4627793.1 hypothetical protein [Candidatus Rokubacteria bacterium]